MKKLAVIFIIIGLFLIGEMIEARTGSSVELEKKVKRLIDPENRGAMDHTARWALINHYKLIFTLAKEKAPRDFPESVAFYVRQVLHYPHKKTTKEILEKAYRTVFETEGEREEEIRKIKEEILREAQEYTDKRFSEAKTYTDAKVEEAFNPEAIGKIIGEKIAQELKGLKGEQKEIDIKAEVERAVSEALAKIDFEKIENEIASKADKNEVEKLKCKVKGLEDNLEVHRKWLLKTSASLIHLAKRKDKKEFYYYIKELAKIDGVRIWFDIEKCGYRSVEEAIQDLSKKTGVSDKRIRELLGFKVPDEPRREKEREKEKVFSGGMNFYRRKIKRALRFVYN